MNHKAQSIRPFIGSKNFEISRQFYKAWGFEETVLFHNISVFKTNGIAFYLQDAYVKDWVDNTMLFLEVADIDKYWNDLIALNLPDLFPEVRLVPIKNYEWGRECFIHDPSGILWHIGEFN